LRWKKTPWSLEEAACNNTHLHPQYRPPASQFPHPNAFEIKELEDDIDQLWCVVGIQYVV
jgi:hypothetical protein